MKIMIVALSFVLALPTSLARDTGKTSTSAKNTSSAVIPDVGKYCDRCCCMTHLKDCDRDCYRLRTMKEADEISKPCNNHFVMRLKEAKKICEGYKHDEIVLNELCVKMCALKGLLEKKGFKIMKQHDHGR